jgi:hypothetical protein
MHRASAGSISVCRCWPQPMQTRCGLRPAACEALKLSLHLDEHRVIIVGHHRCSRAWGFLPELICDQVTQEESSGQLMINLPLHSALSYSPATSRPALAQRSQLSLFGERRRRCGRARCPLAFVPDHAGAGALVLLLPPEPSSLDPPLFPEVESPASIKRRIASERLGKSGC